MSSGYPGRSVKAVAGRRHGNVSKKEENKVKQSYGPWECDDVYGSCRYRADCSGRRTWGSGSIWRKVTVTTWWDAKLRVGQAC